jgi:hypothetical protein
MKMGSRITRFAAPGLTFAVVTAMMVAAFVAPAAAQGNPGGSNGTVKIDGVDAGTGNGNDPHPGCTFKIEFFGYDEGDLTATYSIKLHAPTAGPVVASGSVSIGGDPAGGATDLDGVVPLDISEALSESGVTPHPTQGYHVKVTVNAEGSKGADVKHKTFWVSCESEPDVEPSVEPTIVTSDDDDDDTVVAGEIFTKSKPKGSLATTAAPTDLALLLGAWFIALGWLVRSVRRPEEQPVQI